jgi:hypothetical protein
MPVLTRALDLETGGHDGLATFRRLPGRGHCPPARSGHSSRMPQSSAESLPAIRPPLGLPFAPVSCLDRQHVALSAHAATVTHSKLHKRRKQLTS